MKNDFSKHVRYENPYEIPKIIWKKSKINYRKSTPAKLPPHCRSLITRSVQNKTTLHGHNHQLTSETRHFREGPSRKLPDFEFRISNSPVFPPRGERPSRAKHSADIGWLMPLINFVHFIWTSVTEGEKFRARSPPWGEKPREKLSSP